jgi:hypothetical protein
VDERLLPHSCLIAALLVLLLLIPPAAASVKVSPDVAAPGDLVTVAMTGCADGTHVAVAINVHSPPTGKDWFEYQFADFSIPFALESGTWAASGTNINYLEVKVLKRPADLIYGFDDEGAGSVAVRGSRNVSAGEYTFVALEAEVNDTAKPVDLRFGLSGIKTRGGSDTASLVFRLPDTAGGSIGLSVEFDGENQLDQTIEVISSDVQPSAPAPGTATTAPQSAGPLAFAGAGALLALALAAVAVVQGRR